MIDFILYLMNLDVLWKGLGLYPTEDVEVIIHDWDRSKLKRFPSFDFALPEA